MSGSKKIEKIAWVITALMLVVTILFMNGGALGLQAMAHTMGYEDRLFDNTRVHTLEIVMNDWDEFIQNAMSEEYYAADLVIDGESYKNVAIRGKGNTSLSSVASMGSERYSFKVEFDHYDNSITYHGLDKLSLNNLIQDTTMMKDYLTYTMMVEFGAAAPLCSFVYITVNGEDWGLYLAVEGVEDSFLERNFGLDYGELYKPDSMNFGGGRGNGKDFDMAGFMGREETDAESSATPQTPNMGGFDPSRMPDMGNFDPAQMPDMGNFDFSQMPDMGAFDPSQMPDMGDFDPTNMQSPGGEEPAEEGKRPSFGGGFGMGPSDVKLQYMDDALDSYANIWSSVKTDITEADKTRLVESLRKLSAKEGLETVVDMERVLRYFVVHNFVCNGDSYTGNMIHNYYLYEEDGVLAMLPWDYNLAYGTFQGGNAQSTVNTPIDAPVSGGAGEDRPMWSWILSNSAYTELYHQYFAEFLKTVDEQAIIENACTLIAPYVQKDPTAFYSYEAFEQGVETMRQFCALRSESIAMQLENGETTENMDYVDASALTLSAMGSMGMGGGFGGGRGEGFDPSKMEGGFPGRTETEAGTEQKTETMRPDRGNMPMPGGFNMGMNGMNETSGNATLIWLAVSILILAVGLIIAKLYRW